VLNSIQHFVKGVLDGLATPLTSPLQAVIMPPQLADVAGSPIAYIWGGRLATARQTAPRPFGQQKLTWDISVAVTQVYDQDDETLESAFPLVLDTIMARMMTAPLQHTGVWLTDPVTQNQTQLMAIGERYTSDYTGVFTTSGPGVGMWVYACDMLLVAEELVSFNPGSYYNELWGLGDSTDWEGGTGPGWGTQTATVTRVRRGRSASGGNSHGTVVP
jgi:hypothetical protein